MANLTTDPHIGNTWSRPIWTLLGGVFLLPLLMTVFSSEMAWSGADFAIFGIMLLAAGGLYEVAARSSASRSFRLASALALATIFFLIWVTLAVGIVGTETDEGNLLFAAVPLVAILGAILARLRSGGMALVMLATALVQIAAGIATGSLLAGLLFAALWLASAWLFRRAA